MLLAILAPQRRPALRWHLAIGSLLPHGLHTGHQLHPDHPASVPQLLQPAESIAREKMVMPRCPTLLSAKSGPVELFRASGLLLAKCRETTSAKP